MEAIEIAERAFSEPCFSATATASARTSRGRSDSRSAMLRSSSHSTTTRSAVRNAQSSWSGRERTMVASQAASMRSKGLPLLRAPRVGRRAVFASDERHDCAGVDIHSVALGQIVIEIVISLRWNGLRFFGKLKPSRSRILRAVSLGPPAPPVAAIASRRARITASVMVAPSSLAAAWPAGRHSGYGC